MTDWGGSGAVLCCDHAVRGHMLREKEEVLALWRPRENLFPCLPGCMLQALRIRGSELTKPQIKQLGTLSARNSSLFRNGRKGHNTRKEDERGGRSGW